MSGRNFKKIVGHLHFEGSVPIKFLANVASKNSLYKHEVVWKSYRPQYFATFSAFSKYIVLCAKTLRTRNDFFQAGLLLGERLRKDGALYAEIIWVPQLYLAHTIKLDDILDALNDARYITLKNTGIEMNWIVDLVRGYPNQGEKVVRWLQEFCPRARNIVAVGLGGDETHPLSDMKDLLLSVRDFDIEIYPHSGEQCGPDHVNEVVSILAPRRIAHGIRATEQVKTLQYIQSEGIHLDICPISNCVLKIYNNFQEVPIRKLIEYNCSFSINTDDPALFGTSLQFEINQCMEIHGITTDFIHSSYLNAAKATFLLPKDKALLVQRMM